MGTKLTVARARNNNASSTQSKQHAASLHLSQRCSSPCTAGHNSTADASDATSSPARTASTAFSGSVNNNSRPASTRARQSQSQAQPQWQQQQYPTREAMEYRLERQQDAAAAAEPEKDPRIVEAEKILDAIAQEYAAKRAAGTVPSVPVHPRTLLWEEMARNRSQVGRRGQCVFGRDTGKICGCTSYKKKRGVPNPGGVCECCNHGGPWHRLTGAYAARSSRFTRSIMSSVRGSRFDTNGSSKSSDLRSSAFDSEYDSDDDDLDDEAIANEVARPYGVYKVDSIPSAADASMSERASLLSAASSFGYPSRMSSGVNTLATLLSAIATYRQMGLSEDEIEARIHQDFPPVPPRRSTCSMPTSNREGFQLSEFQHDI